MEVVFTIWQKQQRHNGRYTIQQPSDTIAKLNYLLFIWEPRCLSFYPTQDNIIPKHNVLLYDDAKTGIISITSIVKTIDW